MDLGFKQAGFEIVWANDIYKYACETHKKNFGQDPIRGDVRKIKQFPDRRGHYARSRSAPGGNPAKAALWH